MPTTQPTLQSDFKLALFSKKTRVLAVAWMIMGTIIIEALLAAGLLAINPLNMVALLIGIVPVIPACVFAAGKALCQSLQRWSLKRQAPKRRSLDELSAEDHARLFAGSSLAIKTPQYGNNQRRIPDPALQTSLRHVIEMDKQLSKGLGDVDIELVPFQGRNKGFAADSRSANASPLNLN